MKLSETTVRSQQVERVVDLVAEGHSLRDAAGEVGLSLSHLNKLSPEIREQVRHLVDTFSVEEEVHKAMVRATLVKLLLHEEPDVQMRAAVEAKRLYGMDKTPKIELQIGPRPAIADWAAREVGE